MGWGTEYEGYLSKVLPDEFDNRLEQAETLIRTCMMQLVVLAAMTPQGDSMEEITMQLTSEVEGIVETLMDEASIRNQIWQAQVSEKLVEDV